MLVGLSLLNRKSGCNQRLRIRFSLLLVCLGYLLVIFILVYHGLVRYQGLLKLTHDCAAILLGASIFDYVRCSLKFESTNLWIYSPIILYLISWLLLPEFINASIDVPQLIGIVILYTTIALLTYIGHMLRRHAAGLALDRAPNAELLILAAVSLSSIQFAYLVNSGVNNLFMVAPLLGTVLVSLFFVFYILYPSKAEFFFRSISPRTSQAYTSEFQQIASTVAYRELFLDSKLSIGTLAEALNYKPRELSEIINAQSGGSFYEFINAYRIACAKTYLESEQEKQTSIEAIALLCGFKPRSSFYEAFRRETGLTPGSYRNFRK